MAKPAPKSNLIECQDCGAKVSRKAAACPSCGCPVPPPTSVVEETLEWIGMIWAGLGCLFKWGLLLLILGLIGAFLRGMASGLKG